MKELSLFLEDFAFSSLYTTSPMYVLNQPFYINAVVSGFTYLSAQELLSKIHEIEAASGRDRSKEVFKGQRSLDIDILLFASDVIKTETLSIPHLLMRERLFVLVPLLELESTQKDPETGKLFSEYLEEAVQIEISVLKKKECMLIHT